MDTEKNFTMDLNQDSEPSENQVPPMDENASTLAKSNHYDENSDFIRSIHESMEAEITAAGKYSPTAVPILQDGQTILDLITALASTRVRGDGIESVRIQDMLHDYMTVVTTVLNGGILTPLTGSEDEWVDINIDPNSNRSLEVTFRGQTYNIDFKSVQVNRRFPKIYRFNKDNRLAHRDDLVRVVDPNHPGHFYTTKVSRRFIKFPYMLETVTEEAIMSKDGESVVSYIQGTEQDIIDKMVFRIGDKVLLAPPVPVHLLKKAGIDIDAELAQA